MGKKKWCDMKSDRTTATKTKNGKLVYSPGTVHTASDGRKYVTAPDGGWRRMDKIEEK